MQCTKNVPDVVKSFGKLLEVLGKIVIAIVKKKTVNLD